MDDNDIGPEPQREFTLIDEDFFPSFEDLPDETDQDLDLRYYDESGQGGYPIKHWCLLVELVTHIPYLRPMFIVKDRDDRELLVAFHLDKGVPFPPNHPHWKKWLVPGNVMAIMYAHRRILMDGQAGVRIEDWENVKILPGSLSQMMQLGADLELPQRKCRKCTNPGQHKCAGCPVRYCSKECQVADWQTRHRRECATARQIAEWSTRDWTDFDDFWSD